jgi:hypothetical protein
VYVSLDTLVSFVAECPGQQHLIAKSEMDVADNIEEYLSFNYE